VCLCRKRREERQRPDAIIAIAKNKMGNPLFSSIKTERYPTKIPAPPPCNDIFIRRLIIIKSKVTIAPDKGRA
jgi:hypothetical protein